MPMKLSSLDGTNGLAVGGLEALDGLGVSIDRVGDVNEGGNTDVVTGSSERSRQGAAYVTDGGSGKYSTVLALVDLEEDQGVALSDFGVVRTQSYLGAGAGDFNGDDQLQGFAVDQVLIGGAARGSAVYSRSRSVVSDELAAGASLGGLGSDMFFEIKSESSI